MSQLIAMVMTRRLVHLTTVLRRASLTKWFTSTSHTFAYNWQQPFLNQREIENDRMNYFMINLHEGMGPG